MYRPIGAGRCASGALRWPEVNGARRGRRTRWHAAPLEILDDVDGATAARRGRTRSRAGTRGTGAAAPGDAAAAATSRAGTSRNHWRTRRPPQAGRTNHRRRRRNAHAATRASGPCRPSGVAVASPEVLRPSDRTVALALRRRQRRRFPRDGGRHGAGRSPPGHVLQGPLRRARPPDRDRCCAARSARSTSRSCACSPKATCSSKTCPGVGKTSLAKAIARSIGGSWRRIQFTPDLLPSDVTGASVWDRARNDFEFRPGGVFANVVLADEINRASPKTQSALLEAMEERQVTVDTTDLPAADAVHGHRDAEPGRARRHVSRCPRRSSTASCCACASATPTATPSSRSSTRTARARSNVDELEPVCDAETVAVFSKELAQIHIAPELQGYVVDLVDATRHHRDLMLGVSPRGALALQRAARALAASVGRAYVVPDDIKALAPSVLEHRLVLSPEAMMRGVSAGRRAHLGARERARCRPTARPSERAVLTRRGWSLLGAATGLYIGSRVLGLVQLVVLAASACCCSRSPRCGCASTRSTSSPSRHLRERLQVGVDGRVDVVGRVDRRPGGMPTLSVVGRVRPRPPLGPLPARAARAGRDRARRVPPPDRSARPLRARAAARHGRRSVRTREPHPTRARHRRGHRVPARARDHVAARDRRRRARPRHAARARPPRSGRRVPQPARLRARRRPAARALALDRATRPADGAPERSAAAHAGARDARRATRRATTARRSSARSKRARRS